jgi:hypothetical protein
MQADTPPLAPRLEQQLLGQARQFMQQGDFALAFVNAVTAAEVLIYEGIAQRLIAQTGVARTDVPQIMLQNFGNRVLPEALVSADIDLSDQIREVFGLRACFLRGGSHIPLTRREAELAIRLARTLAEREHLGQLKQAVDPPLVAP